ncbi:hypothetical protein C8J56DRAFT_444803 [Mycena floridula]|nr:hypothetical protein C8J56DRAFT_444803 [Mycena floridula]
MLGASRRGFQRSLASSSDNLFNSTPTTLKRLFKADNCHTCCRRNYFSATRVSQNEQIPEEKKPGSIFSPQVSTWDHVFNDIKDMPPLIPTRIINPLRRPEKRPRKHAMTAREISAFEDMFEMIFNAVSRHKATSTQENVGIGGNNMDTLFGKLRRHSKRMKWTTASDEKLDQQKEAMELCDTDVMLLNWAMEEVFGESERYEKEYQKALAEAANGNPPKEVPLLQPPTYPHLIALLMRAFRDKYHDPHLALSMFQHAKHLSIESYVFGCSTMAYNELIDTQWRCFRDLEGVHDTLQEMSVNGVDYDNQTRKLVETVRREVGSRTLWIEEDGIRTGEVWTMLNKIEALVLKDPVSTESSDKWDDWKARPMKDREDDDQGFDRWEAPESDYHKPRGFPRRKYAVNA